jgi:hypothetical protein
MSAIVTVKAYITPDYDIGDYAKLCGNSGSGSVDYDNPLSNIKISLRPNTAGSHGFGEYPFGDAPFGDGEYSGMGGFGDYPFGEGLFGVGCLVIEASYQVNDCGNYKFGFAVYDKLGNLHSGIPADTTAYIHIPPAAPDTLKQKTYNSSTDTLVLETP